MNTEPFRWIVAILLGLVVSSWIRTYIRLRHIPGPPGVGFSKLWLLKKSFGGRFHLDTLETCEKYGSIVRIGPNELITNDIEVVRRTSAVRSPYVRSNWYDGLRFDPGHNTVLSESDEQVHLVLRTKMGAGYSGKEIDHLEQSIDANIAQLVELLTTKYLSTTDCYKPVDLAPKFQYFTLDVISDIAFGKSLGNLEADQDVWSFIKTVQDSTPLVIFLAIFPGLSKIFFSRLCERFWPKVTDSDGLGKLMAIAKDVVAERFGPNRKTHRDMIGSFIRHGLTQREAEAEAVLQFFAGAETSAIAIRATLLYITTNPQVCNSLLSELSSATISDPITDEEARKLPYLQAVIKEGLRLYPPITGLALKLVPAGGDTLKGHYIPGGTKIGWTPFGMMMNTEVWGADAKLFRPERWFEGSSDEKKRREMDVDMVFGYGKYLCLGRNIALMELNKIFVQLLRNFDFAVVDPTQPWKTYNVGLHMQSDMWMRVTKRIPSF
ncbi:pisatin demethylase [Hyaloscypha variabilis F]|uniref:Pisatin demethylase n=1 Tax=Hyaloscypha variabilis (strain UAMH 11265 / GT02V1 / F) TaxID=1149755 RepID=A0A2J6QRW0_HYAVF|nr:pisatin demethylase [Hyaloscypha variabilis F]